MVFAYVSKDQLNKKNLSVELRLFSYPLVLTCVLGAQKNRLIETVLLSTDNICFGRVITKINFNYAILSGDFFLI